MSERGTGTFQTNVHGQSIECSRARIDGAGDGTNDISLQSIGVRLGEGKWGLDNVAARSGRSGLSSSCSIIDEVEGLADGWLLGRLSASALS